MCEQISDFSDLFILTTLTNIFRQYPMHLWIHAVWMLF